MKKKSLSKKTLCLAAAALTLTAGLSVGSAMAYFTTYTQSEGGAVLDLGFTTTVPREEVDNWAKHVTVENTGDYPCMVRVRAFAGSQVEGRLTYSGANWSLAEDGYYYYSQILEPHTITPESDVLDIHIDNTGLDQDFNVIVVQEHAPVYYDEDGNPQGDWENVLDSQEQTDSGEEAGE